MLLYRSYDWFSEGGADHVEARDGHVENFFFIGYNRNKDQDNKTLCCGFSCFTVSEVCYTFISLLHISHSPAVTQSVEGVVTLHVL